jgi:hypothetical protein
VPPRARRLTDDIVGRTGTILAKGLRDQRIGQRPERGAYYEYDGEMTILRVTSKNRQ